MNLQRYTLNVAAIATFIAKSVDLLRLILDAYSVNLNVVSVLVGFMKLLRVNIGDELQFVARYE